MKLWIVKAGKGVKVKIEQLLLLLGWQQAKGPAAILATLCSPRQHLPQHHHRLPRHQEPVGLGWQIWSHKRKRNGMGVNEIMGGLHRLQWAKGPVAILAARSFPPGSARSLSDLAHFHLSTCTPPKLYLTCTVQCTPSKLYLKDTPQKLYLSCTPPKP